MKKQPKIPNDHLVGAPYTYALEVARATSGLTYEQIAHDMDLGRETVHRYFTDPDYQPPTKRLPRLCKVLGNDILLDWVCLNSEGYFVRVPCGARETSLDLQIAQLTKDFSDVLQADGDARLDRQYTANELERIDRELSELIVKGQQYRNVVRRMIPVP